jgi:5-oxoprolinase (ATP-hydrolysing)
LRKGSGGQGAFPGGDGVIRQMRFLEPMTATILSSHRQTVPYGLDGGEAGLCGENSVLRSTGETVQLQGNDEVEMASGDTFIIKTPGGGGFGTVPQHMV